MTTPYKTGTVSVTTGIDIVTGSGTGWLTSGLVAGQFGLDSANGNPVPVEEIISDTELRLAKPWRGSSASAQAYWITYDTQPGQQTVANAQRLSEYIARLNNPSLAAVAGVAAVANSVLLFTGTNTATTVSLESLVNGADFDVQVDTIAARAAYNGQPANFRVLVSNTGDGRAAVYSKKTATSGDWSNPAYITGEPGPTGSSPTLAATATRLAAGAAPTAIVSPTSDGFSIAFGIPEARTSGFPFRWSTTTTDANPGNGLIRANNAALGSATLLFVSKTSLAGSAMATFLLGMAASDNAIKGTLIIQRVTDGQTVSFNVTGVTDATNYVKVAVSGQSGLTAIANNTDLNFLFTQAGNRGLDGTGTGDVSGPNVAVNNRLAMFDGTTGKLLKDSGYGIGTSGNAVPLLSGSLTWSGAQVWTAAATANIGLTVGVATTGDGFLLVTNNLSTAPPIATFSSFRPSILLEDRTASAQNAMIEADGNLFRLYSSAVNDGTGLTERLRVNLTNGAINAFGEVIVPASTAASAMLNVPHGVAPTTLANGDVWTQTTGVFARVNGVTLNLSPALISQALAEGGIDTAIWSWSSQRIRQAIIASPAALLDTEDQTLTGGARVTSKSLGTISTGTLTLDPGDRPLQHYTNNGAHTLAPGANTGSFLLDITNGASAGAITVTGWTKVSGDAFTTTSGNKFRLHCSVGNGGSLLIVQALQ